MKIKQDFPHRVREIENQWITLADGTRLAARIWLPKNAETTPVPVILEYLPYRKRDGTAARDELTHPWLAGHGYACVRVDMRGNGESDGLMEDEYAPQEQADALEVIDWIAAQPWCSGKLGMMGISWGASTACNWPRSDPNRSRRSSPCAPPTTATPTISTTRAATCCWRIWAGRRPC